MDSDSGEAETVHRNPWYSVTRRVVPATEAGDPEQVWFRVVRPDSAMVVAVTAADEYVMIRGTRDTTGTDELYEFPCGAIDPGEGPMAAAVREAREEAGAVLVDVESLGTFVKSPAISTSSCHVFRAVATGFTAAELEPGEHWQLALVPRLEANRLVATGQIRDGETLAALAMIAAAG